jgi:hypothetical protein
MLYLVILVEVLNLLYCKFNRRFCAPEKYYMEIWVDNSPDEANYSLDK